MPCVIFDLKGILIPKKSCIEEFGKDLTLYNIRNGSPHTFKSVYTGALSAFAKRFGNGYAYKFAKHAFRWAPKWFVEECSEKYRKLVPEVSKRVVKKIRDLGINTAIITHDIHSLLLGVYDELGFDPEKKSDDLMDNDFSYWNDRVSGIIYDEYGWPRVHEKAYTLKKYMLKKNYKNEDIVLVGHGPEEVSMARIVKNRIIVPQNAYKKLKKDSIGVYEELDSLPELIARVFSVNP